MESHNFSKNSSDSSSDELAFLFFLDFFFSGVFSSGESIERNGMLYLRAAIPNTAKPSSPSSLLRANGL